MDPCAYLPKWSRYAPARAAKGEIFGNKKNKQKLEWPLLLYSAPQVDEPGGNCYKGKTAHSSTNESDSLHATLVILQTYAFSSTVSTMSQEQKSFCAIK